MRYLVAVLSLLLLFEIFDAAPSARRLRKRYRPRGRYRKSDFRNQGPANPTHLVGPDGESFYRGLDLNQEPGALISPSGGSPGSPVPSYIRTQRSQVAGDFGHNPVPPGSVPPGSIISIGSNIPPDPNLEPQIAEGIEQMDMDEREAIALEFFVRANYTPQGLSSKKSMVRLMQRNYGLPQTGELDEKTVSMMMAPRCGYPDPPANYQTFPNRPRWNKNPVTYKFTGYTPDMSPCQVRNALKRAFRVWEEVTPLDFVESESDDADIIIYFGYQRHGDDYPFDDKNGLLAHAFTAGTQPISGDTHFDEAEFWTLGNGRVTETYYGTANGASCYFPFIFENEEYTTCTAAGRSDGLEWCSTTRNYDQDGEWGFCSQETLFTYGGNADGDPCKFPFVFQGKSYDTCTLEGRSDGYRWCATTSSFDDDTRWGFCPDRAHGTYGGNSNGASCAFPFIFNGDTYSDCTVVGRSDYLPWCSTTPNYDRDQKFGFCQDSGYSIFLVAAHEFGHAIGLDHSNLQSALMYPMYQKFENFRLPEDDRRGAQDLYPEERTTPLRPLVLETCGGDLRTDTTITTTSTTTTISTTTTTKNNNNNNPDPSGGICDEGPIDGLLSFGTEIFLFKGREFWRMFDHDGDKRGPYVIREQWPGLPSTIDSVYRKPADDALVFFKGTRYWIYDGFQLRAGYPKKVTSLGLPKDGEFKVDASLNWYRSKDRKRTYFFVGKKYYRFNEPKNKMDNKYPKSSSAWRSVPSSLEAAMEDPTSKRQSLFVKDNIVHVLHNYKVEVIDRIPLRVWLGCEERGANPVPIVASRRTKDRKIP
ncbi:unnamed protein product [Clavelina lepadiformis]|uniref:Fibronectin type-II domain-containing protein n=1 Tax=Clavelina lepadiformis TaxID=159417 RepID=A0ABP0FRA0_CLALP